MIAKKNTVIKKYICHQHPIFFIMVKKLSHQKGKLEEKGSHSIIFNPSWYSYERNNNGKVKNSSEIKGTETVSFICMNY